MLNLSALRDFRWLISVSFQLLLFSTFYFCNSQFHNKLKQCSNYQQLTVLDNFFFSKVQFTDCCCWNFDMRFSNWMHTHKSKTINKEQLDKLKNVTRFQFRYQIWNAVIAYIDSGWGFTTCWHIRKGMRYVKMRTRSAEEEAGGVIRYFLVVTKKNISLHFILFS